MREQELKIALLNWLQANIEPSEIIASELQFSNATNRADLVLISPTRLVAYEIKSTYDDFRRFSRQQTAYRETFLESYLVVPEKRISEARNHVARFMGLVTVSLNGDVIIHKTGHVKKRLARSAALAWLTASEKRKLKLDNYTLTKANLLSERQLTSIALLTLHRRLSIRFENFRKEIGTNLNSDDLRMLSLPTRVR